MMPFEGGCVVSGIKPPGKDGEKSGVWGADGERDFVAMDVASGGALWCVGAFKKEALCAFTRGREE